MKRTTFLLLFFLSTICLLAQGGGPPMLTTDPGTPGNHHWEINTSLNYQFSSQSGIQVPTTEIIYGIGNNYQISVQLPMPDIDLQSHSTSLTQPQIGIKWQVLDEQKSPVSMAIYPQVVISLEKGGAAQVFIPLEFEKTFSNFRVGEEIGYFVLNNPHALFNGTIIGYQLKSKLELMSEFFLSTTTTQPRESTTGLLNFGCRKQVSQHLVLMSSLGTELITPESETRQYLFGLVGVQILLGE